jgi:RNA polymerase sigma factor for flagellar operon FliA
MVVPRVPASGAVADADDRDQDGHVGLVHAARRYNPATGVGFAAFAIPRIRGAILDSARRLDPLSRVARERSAAVAQADERLTADLGRPPDNAQIAAATGIAPHLVRGARRLDPTAPASLDAANHRIQDADDDTPTLAEIIPDPAATDTLVELCRAESLTALRIALRRIPEREQRVLALYYRDERTMKEIARALGVSESRICQLHAQALRRLRAMLITDDGR